MGLQRTGPMAANLRDGLIPQRRENVPLPNATGSGSTTEETES